MIAFFRIEFFNLSFAFISSVSISQEGVKKKNVILSIYITSRERRQRFFSRKSLNFMEITPMVARKIL